MEATQFEQLGFYKDYYSSDGLKYLGSIQNVEKDRDAFGYYGRKKETIETDIIFNNKKRIKKGTEILTELQILCGKIIKNA